jgi:peptidoglycan L-alanyl-D-glutamate endopeptidase CwlK
MASRRIEDLHPILRPLAVQFIADCVAEGIRVIITCTYRSPEEQDELYAQGRTKPGRKVTNAKAGQSEHNTQLNGTPAARAFDIAIKDSTGKLNWDAHHRHWKRAGEIGKALGLVWGGDWKIRDLPHFELPKGQA